MDDDSKELAKIGAEAAVKPFGELLTKLLGGPCEQIGGILEDVLFARRQDREANRQTKRLLKTLKKTQNAIEEAAFEPQQVPDYIWIPFVQGAALHDDETIQDMWANLLANSANPENENPILPVFTAILRELAPNDALFLNTFSDAPESPYDRGIPSSGSPSSNQLIMLPQLV